MISISWPIQFFVCLFFSEWNWLHFDFYLSQCSLPQKWDKKLPLWNYIFWKEREAKCWGGKVEFLIFHTSSGKALSVNICNNFHITLGRDKISVWSPAMQLRFFTTTLDNSNSLGTNGYLHPWVTQMHLWESHSHGNVSRGRRVGYPEN